MRSICALLLILAGLALPGHAQIAEQGNLSFSASFLGSVNSSGAIMKAEPMLTYKFNNHVETYGGLPFYFVSVSSPITTTTPAKGGFMTGLGNAFVGMRLGVDGEAARYSSTLEFTAPTGDKSRGFSTGRVTADWTNRVSYRLSSLTPFGSIGVANTISDTSFFLRPFSSLGLIGHFEGGATYDLSRDVWVGGSAYGVRASGQQRIVNRGASRPEMVVPADIANDHGFSTWFGVSPRREVAFHAGYSRSVNYGFNSFFFGIGFQPGR